MLCLLILLPPGEGLCPEEMIVLSLMYDIKMSTSHVATREDSAFKRDFVGVFTPFHAVLTIIW